LIPDWYSKRSEGILGLEDIKLIFEEILKDKIKNEF